MALFVSCGPSLELLLAAELQQLGFTIRSQGYRGVYVAETAMEAIYTINYCSRIASRVLLPLRKFQCRNSEDLYANVKEIDWRPYLPKGATLAVDANVHHRKLRNSLFVAQIVKDGICDQLRHTTGHRPTVDLKDPSLQLNIFIDNEHAVLSFDTSGQPLHKRGYRQESAAAPLQETLAASLLQLAGFDGSETVVDPCCGSGTLLIEAALIASKTAPGYLRKKWGFFAHPQFDNSEWLKVKNRADSARVALSQVCFFGSEIDRSALCICRENLRAAGFANVIEVSEADFRKYSPQRECNFLISNPPHGRRLDSEDNLSNLYRKLGEFMKGRLAKLSRGFIFTSNLALGKQIGLAAKRRHIVNYGNVDARLLEFDLY